MTPIMRFKRAEYEGINPQTLTDRHAISLGLVHMITATIAVVSLRFVQQHWLTVRELTWKSAQGVIEETRPIFVSERSRERRVLLRRSLLQLSDSELNRQRWKDAMFTVRRNPSNALQIDADVY